MKGSGELANVSRRRWLKTLLGFGTGLVMHPAKFLAWAADMTPASDESTLTVRVSRPFEAETPVRAFTSFLTPNDHFFVRSHFGPPSAETVGESQWTLHVGAPSSARTSSPWKL
jgi:sulfite oxidase